MKSLFGLLIALCLVGCASVPMGDPKRDAELKEFKAAPDKAALYIYRNEVFGAAIKIAVDLDGKHIGRTASKTYLYQELAPGEHTIVSRAEEDDTLKVNLKAGTLTYVWQEIKLGLWNARTRLQIVSDEVGRKGVTESKLAVTE